MVFYKDAKRSIGDVHVGPAKIAATIQDGSSKVFNTFSITSNGAKKDDIVYFGRYDGSGLKGTDGVIQPYLVVANDSSQSQDDENGNKTWNWARGLNLMPGDDYQDSFGELVQRGIICMWGDVYVGTNKVYSYSDSRLKTNILDSEVCSSDIINKIEVKSFDWIASQEHISAGLIAQQLEMVLPEMVTTNSDTDIKSINYNGLIPYLIKGFQELDKRLKVCEMYRKGDASTLSVNKVSIKSKPAAFGLDDKASTWSDNMTSEEKLPYVRRTVLPRFKEDIN